MVPLSNRTSKSSRAAFMDATKSGNTNHEASTNNDLPQTPRRSLNDKFDDKVLFRLGVHARSARGFETSRTRRQIYSDSTPGMLHS